MSVCPKPISGFIAQSVNVQGSALSEEWGVGRLEPCQMQAPLTPPLGVFLICLTDTSGGISCFYSVSTASTAPASINKTLSG